MPKPHLHYHHKEAHLIEGGQHFIGHVILEHPWRDEHLIKVRVLRPDRLVHGLMFIQDLPGIARVGG